MDSRSSLRRVFSGSILPMAAPTRPAAKGGPPSRMNCSWEEYALRTHESTQFALERMRMGPKASNRLPPRGDLSLRPKAMPHSYDLPNYPSHVNRLPPSAVRSLARSVSNPEETFLPARLPNGKRYNSRLRKSPPRREPLPTISRGRQLPALERLPALEVPDLQERLEAEGFGAPSVPGHLKATADSIIFGRDLDGSKGAPPKPPPPMRQDTSYMPSPEALGAFASRPHEKRKAASTESDAKANLKHKLNLYFTDMEGAFRDLDKDGSGTLDTEELLQVLARVSGGNVGPAERALVAQMDKDGDGTVDYHEFVSTLGEIQKATKNQIMNSVSKIREHINTKYKKIGDAFRTMDEDHSGEISIAELEEGLLHLNLNIPTSHIKALIKEFDSDRSGTVSFSEFAAKLREFAESQETAAMFINKNVEALSQRRHGGFK